MKKNFKQNLVDFRGVLLVDRNEKGEDTPITLDTVSINSLLVTDEESARLSGMEKMKRFTLAQKIYTNPEEVEVTEEEVQLIKDQIGKHAPVILTGCAWALLDKE